MAKATNILCFGPDGIDLKFDNYGNVVLVKGTNYDNPGSNDEDRSNATGKSSIPELLSIGLYGRTIKKPTKIKGVDFINTLADKGEVVIEWDDYRVVRTFKKTSSGASSKIDIWESKDHIWDDESKKTLGTSSESQKWIEDKLGLSHKAFCSIVIFDDSDKYQFLEMDGPDKRAFVESLIGLDVFRDFYANAKILLKNHKRVIETLVREYEILQDTAQSADSRIAAVKSQEQEWKNRLNREVMQILEKIKSKQVALQTSDTGKLLEHWQSAQEDISKLTTEIADLESKRSRFQEVVNDAREKMESARTHRDAINGKLQEHHLAMKASEQELQRHLDLINKLGTLTDGAKCPTCHGVISKNNYGTVLKHSKNAAESSQSEIQNHKKIIHIKKEEFGEKAAKLSTMEIKIAEAEKKFKDIESSVSAKRNKISQLSALSKPDGNSEERVLEAEISELKKQAKAKKEECEGDSPYKEIIEQEIQNKSLKEADAKTKSQEIKDAEEEFPYLEFWVNAFAEKGIRKYVVDGVIPALNSRIYYWLQFLIDGRIELTFDNELEETVIRSGNSSSYHGGSRGEGRRINLAVSQAFAYVMMLNSGSCPSLVFLDEITGGSVDRAGVVGVYNMIFELAKERQVFVTTHNENLLTMLQGCETIKLEKRDDITCLV